MQKFLLFAFLLTLKMCAIVNYVTIKDNHTIINYENIKAQYEQWKKNQGIVSLRSNAQDSYKFQVFQYNMKKINDHNADKTKKFNMVLN